MRSVDTNLQKKAASVISAHIAFELQKLLPSSTDYTVLRVLESELNIKIPTLRKVIYNATPSLLTAKKMVIIERKVKSDLTNFISFNQLAVKECYNFLLHKNLTTREDLLVQADITDEYLQGLLDGNFEAPPKVLNDLFEPFVDEIPPNILGHFSKSCSRLQLLAYRTGLSITQLVSKDFLNITDKRTVKILSNDLIPSVVESYTPTFSIWESFYFELIKEYGISYAQLPIEQIATKLKSSNSKYLALLAKYDAENSNVA